jgi:hypothetical protein
VIEHRQPGADVRQALRRERDTSSRGVLRHRS